MPYVPPFDFDFPDYKSVGKTLLEITRAPPYENEPPPMPEVKDDELSTIAWDRLLPLPDIGALLTLCSWRFINESNRR